MVKSLLRFRCIGADAALVPPKQELLVGKVYEDGITLVARSGNCSISFARAKNLHDAVRA